MKKVKKKRVMYPWVGTRQGRSFKAMIAVICDKEINWESILEKGKSVRKTFHERVFPKLTFYFPNMYMSVAKFYSKKGRSLSKSEFENLCFMRMTCIYKIRKKSKTAHKTSEHPLLCKSSKLKKAYKIALKIYKSEKTYEDHYKEKE